MKKATLVEIITDADGMEHLVPVQGWRPSCATCRWAVAIAHAPDGRLHCRRLDQPDAGERIQSVEQHATERGAQFRGARAALLVTPDFGCVRWEGK